MKAVVLSRTGGIENLVVQEVERPKIQAGEVLVAVKSLSVNPVDYKVRGNEDVLTMIYGAERPAILGWDIAGTVVELGQDITDIKKGDRVFGMVNFLGTGKAYAEYVAAPAHHLAVIPENISFDQAAASTLAALTALQVLQNNISKGDRVLIHAGSGGVGHFAIQIAKSLGAHVISTSSLKNKDFIMSIGADQHIDYHEHEFQEVLSNIDFVFDMFNGQVLLNSVRVARQGGKVVSIPSPEFEDETVELAKAKEVDLSFHMVQSSKRDMETIADLLESGKVKPYISKSFEFDEIPLAHKHLESGRTVGKIIVNL